LPLGTSLRTSGRIAKTHGNSYTTCALVLLGSPVWTSFITQDSDVCIHVTYLEKFLHKPDRLAAHYKNLNCTFHDSCGKS